MQMISLTIACRPMLELSTPGPTQLVSNLNTSLQGRCFVYSCSCSCCCIQFFRKHKAYRALDLLFLRGWTVRVCLRTSRHVPVFVVRVLVSKLMSRWSPSHHTGADWESLSVDVLNHTIPIRGRQPTLLYFLHLVCFQEQALISGP